MITYQSNKSHKVKNKSQAMSFDSVLAEYEKCMVPPNPSMGKRKLQDWVNGDGVIHRRPGYLRYSLWVENVELTRVYCNSHNAGRDMIWEKLCECWKYSYFGCGGSKGAEVQKFRVSLK